MQIARTRGFFSLLAIMLLPVTAVAQSTFDSSFRFRNDAETPASTESGKKDYVFRNDQELTGQENGTGPKSKSMGDYRFRAPRKQRTLNPTYTQDRAACFEPGSQPSQGYPSYQGAQGYQNYQSAPAYQGYQGYQANPTYQGSQPTQVAPLPYTGQSPYLTPGYQGSYINPGNYMPGYNSYTPGGFVPSW
jgi:hypothetical protein